MRYYVAAILSLVALSSSSAFVTNTAKAGATSSKSIQSCNTAFIRPSANAQCSTTNLGMSAVETQTDSAYDVVKVDLSDGRDYPIYIGDGFDDEEAGKLLRSHIKGNRALLVTNDKLSPLYLEKYEKLLNEGGDIKIGKLPEEI